MLLDLGVAARRNDRTNRRPRFGRGQRVEDLVLVIGPIAAQRLDGGLDLCPQRLDLPRIILAVDRQGLRDDLAGGLINPEVQCAPRAPLAPAVLTHLPFAFAIHFQPGRIHHQVHRFVSPLGRPRYG